MMNKKSIIITAIIIVLYTFLLSLIGIFGETIQRFFLHYGLLTLKYGLVLFGFFLSVYLPYKIPKQLAKNKSRKEELIRDLKLQVEIKRKKELENKILEARYKAEDSI